MELKGLSKLATFLGIAAIMAYGFFYVNSKIVGQDSFSKLTPDQTFIIFIVSIILGFLALMVILFIAYKKVKPISRRRKKKIEKPPTNFLKYSIITFSILGLLFLIWLSIQEGKYFQSKTNQKLIYHETFDAENYSEIWNYGIRNASEATINNSLLLLTAKTKYNISRRIDLQEAMNYPLSTVPSFDIRLKIKSTQSEPDLGYGLQWYANSRESLYYSFQINKRKRFSVQIYQYNNPVRSIIDWQNESIISKDGFNILRIEKENDEWYFYINKKRVASLPAFEAFGNEIGFNAPAFSTVTIDWIEIYSDNKIN